MGTSVGPDQHIPWTSIPAVQSAARSLLNSFTAWQQLPARIEAAGHQAMVIENAAAQQSRPDVQTAMSGVTDTLASLQQTFYQTSPQVGQVVAALSQEGGGASLAVVGSTVDVYATMRAALAAMDGAEQTIAGTAPAVLTAAEIQSMRIVAPDGSSQGMGTLLLYGVVGLAVMVLFGKRRHT